MKRIIFLSFLIIFLGTFNLRSQQLSKDLDHSFIASFSSGLLIPTGNLSDVYKIGFNSAIKVGYFFNPNIGARFNIGYGSYPYTSNYSYISGGTLHQIPIKADFLYGAFNNSSFYPYSILGLGEYFFNYSDLIIDGVSQSISTESGFGISLGGGVGYKISPVFSIFAETQFNNVFTTGSSTNFITFNGGISYRFTTGEKHGKKPGEEPTALTPPPKKDDLNTIDAGIGKYGICLTKCPKTFIPQGVNYVYFTAKVYRCTGTGWVPSTDPTKITFTLHNVSQEPGHCLNFGKTKTPDLYFPKLSEETPGNDDQQKFMFEGTTHGTDNDCEKMIAGTNNPHHTGHWQQIWTKSPVTEITVVVRSEDYGAFGWIEVAAEGCVQIPAREDSLSDPPCPKNKCCSLKPGYHTVQTEWIGPNKKIKIENHWVKIPRDNNNNGIADICTQDSCGADFENAVKDEDNNPSNNNKGDGLTAYEEYRGFMVNPTGDKSVAVHRRTSVNKKNVFIFVKSDFNVGDFALFNESELDVNLIYDPKLIGAPGKPGQEKEMGEFEGRIIIGTPGSEINYNRKSYTGLADPGACAQHCIPIIKSDDYAASFPKKEGVVKAAMKKFGGCVTSKPPTNTWERDIQAETDDGTPGQIYCAVINVSNCGDVPNRLQQVIAHELGHGVNIKHHGEGGLHFHGNDKYFYSKTLTSGVDNCIMRYDHKGYGWCEKGCDKDNLKIHMTYWNGTNFIDPVGTTFCDSKTGTGVNSVQVGNNTVTNDAKEGNCKSKSK